MTGRRILKLSSIYGQKGTNREEQLDVSQTSSSRTTEFANTGIAHESLFLTEWSQFIYYSFRAAVQDLSSKE